MQNVAAILALMIPIVAIVSVFVVRPWLRMHYESLNRNRSALSVDEQQAMVDLRLIADRMENRLVTLERILDSESPGWRDRT